MDTNLRQVDSVKNFYREVLDSLNEGVYFVDRDRRIIFWNKGAEQITGYKSSEVVGKRCSDNILNHMDDSGRALCVDGCPLLRSIEDGGIRESEMYLHHRDGHRVPVRVRTSPIRDETGRIAGAVETFSDNSAALALRQRIQDLQTIAMLDPLTGLANRRYINLALEARLDELRRYGWPVGVLFIDIDHFKSINDTYGHTAGDDVLKMVSRTLLGNSRAYDVVGRWGGEEFIAILVNVDQARLKTLAEKFRVLIAQSTLTVGTEVIGVKVSIGATLAKKDETADLLLKRADRLMYESKIAGRNRTTLG